MLTPRGSAHSEIEVKKSKFIAIGVKVSSPEDAKEHLLAARKKYNDATHVVHAFVCGQRGDIFGMSDDREPRGTAGRPVLEVLKGSGITNIMVMVVRYFGGTKLGTGGLVKAYTEAAQTALAKIPVEELVEKTLFTLEVPYENFDRVKRSILRHKGEIYSEKFETIIQLSCIIPEETFEDLQKDILAITNGRVQIEKGNKAG